MHVRVAFACAAGTRALGCCACVCVCVLLRFIIVCFGKGNLDDLRYVGGGARDLLRRIVNRFLT